MSASSPALQNTARLILLIGICALLYLIWTGLNRPLGLSDKPAASGAAAVTGTAPEDTRPAEPDIADYADVINRPLFFEDRAPYIAPEPEAPPTRIAPATAPAQNLNVPFTLSAIIISAGKRLAIIHYGRENTLQRIALGQSVDGWTFITIESHSVLVRKGDTTKNLELAIKTSQYPARPAAGDNRMTNEPERE